MRQKEKELATDSVFSFLLLRLGGFLLVLDFLLSAFLVWIEADFVCLV
jgi:hypothetical protein